MFTSATFALNQWVHVAVVRKASPSGFTVYLNGSSVSLSVTGSVTQPAVDPGTTIYIGAFDDTNVVTSNITGNIQDFRFYTAAKYTANFSVATTPTSTTTAASLTGAAFTSTSVTVPMTPTLYVPMTISAVVTVPSGTRTITVSVPLSDFYTYIYPTSITSVSGPTSEIYTADSTSMTLTLTPVDGAPNATAIVYQDSTSTSTSPTQVSTSNGTATGAGVLTASCTFPTAGTWYVYALMTSPTGTAATTKIVCSVPIVVTTYVMPTTVAYDGKTINQATFGTGFGFKQGTASDLTLSFARLYFGNPPSIANAYSSITYTQPSSASSPSIYVTSSTGTKLGTATVYDAFAGWLVLAVPGDAVSDVSATINPASSTKTVTAIGTASTTTTRSKFYGTSLSVPGWTGSANTGFKVTSMPTGFAYEDYTVEGWFYLTSLSAATLFKLGVCTNTASLTNTTTNPTVHLRVESTTYSWVEITNGSYYQARFASTVFTVNTWTHVALVRQASPGNKGTFAVYVNGTAVTLTLVTNLGTRPVGDPGTTMFIGAFDDTNTGSSNMNGNVQDVRFYLAAKYTANFSVASTPVAKTASLVSSTATTMRVTVTPDYYDAIAFAVALKGPASATGTVTCTTLVSEMVPSDATLAVATTTTVTARYIRLTLFYAGGTTGPSFAKLGIYATSASAYGDATGTSASNIARTATFSAVSGDTGSATTTAMLACVNDTRTSWAASTTGTTFGTTSAAGPAYYTLDLGSAQT
ncbi:MAG: hypothetical protein EBZ77_08140, partial [Chitinophagia bacterium]|nr:hypothetical protein [Chitinophagia bacterium]